MSHGNVFTLAGPPASYSHCNDYIMSTMLGCRVTECSSKRAAKDQYEADQTKIPSALTNNTRAQPRAG